MNASEIVSELQSLYPGKNIIQIPESSPKEIICEIDPTSEHPEKNLALAIIDESSPHYHRVATETYTVEKGELTLYVGDEVHLLKAGESYDILPGVVHWASGDAVWVKVLSTPGWTPADYILINK